MRVLVLGWGSMGKRHAANALALGHEVANFDPAAAGLDDGRVRRLGTEDEAFAWKPDAVVVASPAREHARQFWRCRAAGLHVYVEKPLALSYQDLLSVRTGDADVRRRGQVERVGYQLRFHPMARAFREEAWRGRIGVPIAGRFTVASDMAAWPGTTYADALLECSHEVDLALWTLGADVEVVGAVTVGATTELLLRHRLDAGPLVSTVHLSGEAGVSRRDWSVRGTRGHVVADWDHNIVSADFVARDHPRVVEHPTVWLGGSLTANEVAYRDALAEFLGAAVGADPDPSACGVGDALLALQALSVAALAGADPRSGRRPERGQNAPIP